MNRRTFLTSMVRSREVHPGLPDQSARAAAGGLEPYIPDANHPWDAIRAGHLLRRATFLPRWNDITTILALTPSAAVDLLLSSSYTPDPPGIVDNITESLEGIADPEYRGYIRGLWRGDYNSLSLWYASVMQQAPLALSEKMAFFWSGHFTSEFEFDMDFVHAPLLYRQNRLFRDAALGNFRQLVKAVTLDGAMLIYLGGSLNIVGRPNENYARELMELFTTGLGHYTEGDIKEAARVLTGWRVPRFSDEAPRNGFFIPYFLPELHDTGAKEFLGVSLPARDATINTEFLVRRDEVERLIDILFEKRTRAIAEFICRKIYKFFVYSSPVGSDETIVSGLADIFIENDFEIRPVMATLLKSAHFFDNINLGAQIKTPAEFNIGLARQLGGNRNPESDMARMDQTLFEPPNVSGWPGYHEWITTTTYPSRSDVAYQLLSSLDNAALVAFIKQFPNYTDVTELTANICALLLSRPLSTQRHDALEKKLLAQAPGYEWPNIINSSPDTAARNLRDMLTAIMALPDFQLC